MSGAIDTTPFALLSRALGKLRDSLESEIEGASMLMFTSAREIEPVWGELDEHENSAIFELAQLVCDIEDQLRTYEAASPEWLEAFLRDFRSKRAGARA